MRKMSRQAGYNFIVGTDGSKGAHLAFLGAMALRRASLRRAKAAWTSSISLASPKAPASV